MATRTGYYVIEDISDTYIYHIYEVINIETDIYNNIIGYDINNYPICGYDEDLYLPDNNYMLYTETQVINFIKNILNGRRNPFRLCENCIRTIIAEKQDRLF